MLSNNLRDYMHRRNITPLGLSVRMRVDRSTVSLWVTGARTPSIKRLCGLCDALACTPNDLTGYHSDGAAEVSRENETLKRQIKQATEVLGNVQ